MAWEDGEPAKYLWMAGGLAVTTAAIWFFDRPDSLRSLTPFPEFICATLLLAAASALRQWRRSRRPSFPPN